jgi:predicted dienelactone hydrolase
MRIWLSAMLLISSIAAALPSSEAVAQSATGIAERASIRGIDLDWFDHARRREVPARLYWPADASKPVPLIVFSHGLGGSRNGYTYLAARWAAHGIASLHVQHTGSDTALWSGNPLAIVDRLQTAAGDHEAAARVGDLKFALDQILSSSSPYARAIDSQRIVAAGHSYGANTSLLTVGARVVRDGRWLEFRDRRYRAAIAISTPQFYGEKDLAGVLAHVAVPTLHITATQDVIKIPGFYSSAGDRIAIFDAVAHPRKVLAVFRGGSHSIFTDRPMTGGPGLNPIVKDATGDLTLAFLDYAFAGDASGIRQWTLAWQDILAQPASRTATRPEMSTDDGGATDRRSSGHPRFPRSIEAVAEPGRTPAPLAR